MARVVTGFCRFHRNQSFGRSVYDALVGSDPVGNVIRYHNACASRR